MVLTFFSQRIRIYLGGEKMQEGTGAQETPGHEPPAQGAEAPEQSKVSVHIMMTPESFERARNCADYAALEGIIEGHPRGNLNSYTNYCFQTGEENLKQYALRRRGYK